MMIPMNNVLTNCEIKEAVLYAVKTYCQAHNAKIRLPIPVKTIAKSFEFIRVIPYSRLIKEYSLSLHEIIQFAKTDDAYTDYSAKSDTYIIYYNDITRSKTVSNRYRWNIAHELGHILLNHHKNYKNTRLFRTELSSEEYSLLEEEADKFAAYLLVPHFLIELYNVRSDVSLMDICKISRPASKRRYKELMAWRRHSKSEPLTEFEITMWQLASGTVKCVACKSIYYGVENQHFCKICGNKVFYSKEDYNMIYSRIEMDESNRPLLCPVCSNEQYIEDGEYCQICGTPIYNDCCDRFHINYPCVKGAHLSGDARFCPYCGEKTTFNTKGILKPYIEEQNEVQSDPCPF